MRAAEAPMKPKKGAVSSPLKVDDMVTAGSERRLGRSLTTDA